MDEQHIIEMPVEGMETAAAGGSSGPLSAAMEAFAKAASELTRSKAFVVVREPTPLESAAICGNIGPAVDRPHVESFVRSLKSLLAGREAMAVCAQDVALTQAGLRGPAGLHGIAGAIQIDRSRQFYFLGGWREEPLCASEIESLARMMAVIWKRVCSPILARAANLTLTGLIEDYSAPCFVMRPDLRVLAMNEPAREFLTTQATLRLVDGRLSAARPAVTGRLRAMAQELSSDDRPRQDMFVPLNMDAATCEIAWLRPAPVYKQQDVLLTVSRLADLGMSSAIAAVFGLSPSERRIVASILGEQVEDDGAAPKLTEGTVRTYTKRLMAKVGIHRRADLFRIAMLARCPLRQHPVKDTPRIG